MGPVPRPLDAQQVTATTAFETVTMGHGPRPGKRARSRAFFQAPNTSERLRSRHGAAPAAAQPQAGPASPAACAPRAEPGRPAPRSPLPAFEARLWRHCLPAGLLQDALQEMYAQEGVFPGQQFKPARRPWTLLNFLFWATVLLSPLFSFALGVFASGSPLLILTFLGFVGAGKGRA